MIKIYGDKTDSLIMDGKIISNYIEKYIENYIEINRVKNVGVFLETLDESKFSNCKLIIFMINIEFLKINKLLESVDIFICKTKHAYKIMQNLKVQNKLKGSVMFTGFTTFIKVNKIKKDYTKFFHGAGFSPFKGTDTVVRSWIDNKLPPLTLTCYDLCYRNLEKYIKDISDKNLKSHNINLTKKLDYQDLIKIKNNIGNHICTSSMEGFGHYINEARAMGSVILTIDAPPMNEMVKYGVLVPYTSTHIKDNGVVTYYTTPNNILKGVKQMIEMSDNERNKIRKKIRKQFKDDRTYFKNMMKKLCKKISKFYQ